MSFLKSFFTQHLATKFMALLLSVVLFMFVQQQIEGKSTIDKIRLEFQLATEERGRYTLVTREIELTDVGIQGTKKDVDALKERLEQNPTRTIEIDSRFLARYEGTTEKSIPINERFLKEHKVIPEELSVTKLESSPLSIHRYDIIALKIALAPGMEENTILKKAKRKHGYEGTLEGGNKVSISFNMPQGQMRAPRFCFADGENRATRTLLVTIENVDDFLNKRTAQSVLTDVRMPVKGFDWRAGKINQARFTEYAEFRVGDRWLPYRSFKDQLRVLYRVHQRSKDIKRDLEVRYLTHEPDRTLEFLLENYELEGPEGGIDFNFDQKTQIVTQFELQMPQGLDESWLDTLVLVLDIAGATQSGDKLDIPLLLDVKDRRKEDVLSKVRIHLAEGKNRAYARYIKK